MPHAVLRIEVGAPSCLEIRLPECETPSSAGRILSTLAARRIRMPICNKNAYLSWEQAKYEVDDASDGKQGARLYRQRPADLVIVDIFMPEKEGLETIEDIRQDFPEVKCRAISGGGVTGSFDYLSYAKTFG